MRLNDQRRTCFPLNSKSTNACSSRSPNACHSAGVSSQGRRVPGDRRGGVVRSRSPLQRWRLDRRGHAGMPAAAGSGGVSEAQDQLLEKARKRSGFDCDIRLLKNDRDAQNNIYGRRRTRSGVRPRLSPALWRVGLVLLVPLMLLTWTGLVLVFLASWRTTFSPRECSCRWAIARPRRIRGTIAAGRRIECRNVLSVRLAGMAGIALAGAAADRNGSARRRTVRSCCG